MKLYFLIGNAVMLRKLSYGNLDDALPDIEYNMKGSKTVC